MKSPIAIVTVGQARFDLEKERYCILGSLRTSNLGIEKVIANVVSNPGIRFLIVCGLEEGHMPADALLSLNRNGVDGDMNIIGARGQLACISDIRPEAVKRFRDQVKVIDLVYPKDTADTIDWADPPLDFDDARMEELRRHIMECEQNNPGPYPDGPMFVQLPEPLRGPMDWSMVLKDQVNRVSSLLLRMPSQQLMTSSGDAVVSTEFEVFIDAVDWLVVQVPSLQFYASMKSYLTGQ
jgi:tetrahydromethanopterin S-methyltransferase subunit A